jgi:hypothetical protein
MTHDVRTRIGRDPAVAVMVATSIPNTKRREGYIYIKIRLHFHGYASRVAGKDYSQNIIDIMMCMTHTPYIVCSAPILRVVDARSDAFAMTQRALCSRIGACTPVSPAASPAVLVSAAHATSTAHRQDQDSVATSTTHTSVFGRCDT